jgi:hypothetical protein
MRQIDRQTNGKTDRQADKQTDRKVTNMADGYKSIVVRGWNKKSTGDESTTHMIKYFAKSVCVPHDGTKYAAFCARACRPWPG